jgi:hypothetical protein
MSNVMKIRLVGAEFHADGLTDVTKLMVTFRNFANAHKHSTFCPLCVLCGSENKQRLFHCTALTDWFL